MPKTEREVLEFATRRMNRRLLLKRAGILGASLPVAGALLSACGDDEKVAASATTPTSQDTAAASTSDHETDDHETDDHTIDDHDTSTNTDSKSSADEAEEMDAMHEAGIRAFPAPTAGLGGQPLEYELDGDVKVFKLTCQIVKEWEYRPGEFAEAWTYNGAVPGPEIRVTEGDTVRIEVTNELHESTAVHWHGLFVPNNMDGVPFLTQPPIKPGETFVYEFPIREGNAGSHMYHSHSNSAEQVTKGLLGAFIVEPKDPSTRPAFDREYTLILNDGPIGGFTINGKSFPATEALTAKKGERVLVRFMNEGLMIHPMHLHGMPMTVIAQDGWLLPQPYMCDTLNIAPGQRFEAIVEANEVGTWVFHCHILSHAESKHGMFGMVTALIVEE